MIRVSWNQIWEYYIPGEIDHELKKSLKNGGSAMKRTGDHLPGDTKRNSVEDADKFTADSTCKSAVSYIKYQASFVDCRLLSSHITILPAFLSSKSITHSNSSNPSAKDKAERNILVFYDDPKNKRSISKGPL